LDKQITNISDINAKIDANNSKFDLITSQIKNIEINLNHKANETEITDIYAYLQKLITRVEYEELKKDMATLVTLDQFNVIKDKVEELNWDIEKNYTPKVLT